MTIRPKGRGKGFVDDSADAFLLRKGDNGERLSLNVKKCVTSLNVYLLKQRLERMPEVHLMVCRCSSPRRRTRRSRSSASTSSRDSTRRKFRVSDSGSDCPRRSWPSSAPNTRKRICNGIALNHHSLVQIRALVYLSGPESYFTKFW